MKYELTTNFIKYQGRKLYQIEALKDFGYVKAGDLGGYIENESNLSQEGNCWVWGYAKIYGNAKVCGYAKVCSNDEVCGEAQFNSNSTIN